MFLTAKYTDIEFIGDSLAQFVERREIIRNVRKVQSMIYFHHGDISPVFYRAVSRAAINFHAVLPLCSLPFTTHTRPIRPFSSATRSNYRLPGIEGTITRLMSCTRHKWANHTSTGSIHKSNRFPSESNSRLLLSRGTSIRRVCNRLYTRLGVEKLVEQTI